MNASCTIPSAVRTPAPARTELVRGVLPLLACSVLWGTVGLASVYAPSTASPESVGAFGIGLAGLLMLLTRPGARRLVRGARGRIRALVLLGSVALPVYPLAFYPAVRILGVATATVITLGSAPLFAGLIARFVQRRPLTRRWLRCAPIAVAGTALLVLGDDGGSGDGRGVVLALIPGLAYAVASTVASRLIEHAVGSSQDVYGAMFGTALLWCVPVVAGCGAGWVLEPRGAAVALYLGCVTNGLGYVLFGSALRYTSAATATTITLTEAAVGALLGVLVHGERLGAAGWVGLGVLACALVMLSLPQRDQDAQMHNISDPVSLHSPS
jgi:drug/metabolite transporter, DME family